MSSAGWYPDPGGKPDLYRYWDGTNWSAFLSPTPSAPPPTGALGQSSATVAGPAAADQQAPTAQPGTGAPPPHGDGSRRSPMAWWIAAGVGVVVIVVLAAFAIRGLTGSGGDTANKPGSSSTRQVCPTRTYTTPDAPGTRDGRVVGGALSYPTLPPPWSIPHEETRVPFGRNAWTQTITIENYTHKGQPSAWVAAVLVAELQAGDGFFDPQAGSEIVVNCIAGAFYGDGKVDRKDRVSKPMKVDGKDAWLVESHLTFDLQGLKTKGELAIVLIVRTGDATSSIFYASIPDTSPQWEQPARQAMAQLRVEG